MKYTMEIVFGSLSRPTCFTKIKNYQTKQNLILQSQNKIQKF